MAKSLLLVALLIVTALVYLPGLGGELIYDDRANLEPVWRWLEDITNWQQVVFGNGSGPLGRPLAMASFLANAAISGDSILALKITNLLLHLVSGVLLFFFLQALAGRDRHLRPLVSWLPLVLTAAWLLHPLMVGTVLYVVQRMAILSALFVLAALLAYLFGRRKIESGNAVAGSLWLFIGVPAFTALAALSKENGLLAPLLCGVVEWVYFIPRPGARRPLPSRLFITVFVALPVLAGLLLLVVHPGFYFDGYLNRPFGPVERLLTQSRVLFDYVGSILLPAGPKFSLLRDDYQLSTGLASPLATLFSVAGWLALAGLTLFFRCRIPGFSAGIAIFLVGHLMESTIFPLLIYFEHRNYLPAIGILWAVAALLAAAAPRLGSKMDHPRAILATGVTLLLVSLAAATFTRATVWSSNELLLRQSLRAYPSSAGLLMELQRIEMSKPFPDIEAARNRARRLLTLDRPSTRLIGMIELLQLDCLGDQHVDPQQVQRTFQIRPKTIEANLFLVLETLSANTRRRPCTNLSPARLAEGFIELVQSTGLPDDVGYVWRLRYLAAQLHYTDGNLPSAYEQARIAWESSGHNPVVGISLASLSIDLGLLERAADLLTELDRLIPATDHEGRRILERNRAALDQKFLNNDRRNRQVLPNLIQDSGDKPDGKNEPK